MSSTSNSTAYNAEAFGRRITERRKEVGLSQAELGKRLGTSTSVIGRYERGEMTPSVEAASRIANELQTTVGYLLGETDQADLLKDPKMLHRLDAIEELPEDERRCAFRMLDALIRDTQTQQAYAA